MARLTGPRGWSARIPMRILGRRGAAMLLCVHLVVAGAAGAAGSSGAVSVRPPAWASSPGCCARCIAGNLRLRGRGDADGEDEGAMAELTRELFAKIDKDGSGTLEVGRGACAVPWCVCARGILAHAARGVSGWMARPETRDN